MADDFTVRMSAENHAARTAPVRVDPAHAVHVGGPAATEICDTLGRAAREGLRLARSARPGDVFELVPPKELAKGIRDGTLRAATPGRGDASVLVKNVKDGRIAGKSDLRRVKPTTVDVIGPAAWQALALATQQHYLAEISGKLDGIKAGVDEILARHDDDRTGALNDISETAAQARVAALRDGTLSDGRKHDLWRAAADAKRLWHQVSTTARRRLEEYRHGKASAADVEQTFAMLAHATHVLAQCSDALAALPYSTESELRAAVAEEQDRLHPALPTFVALCEDLLEASQEWQDMHAEYDLRRPKNRVARRLRVPGVEVQRRHGKFGIDIHLRPEQGPLPDATRTKLRGLVSIEAGAEPELLAEVQADGTVLVGRGQA